MEGVLGSEGRHGGGLSANLAQILCEGQSSVATCSDRRCGDTMGDRYTQVSIVPSGTWVIWRCGLKQGLRLLSAKTRTAHSPGSITGRDKFSDYGVVFTPQDVLLRK